MPHQSRPDFSRYVLQHPDGLRWLYHLVKPSEFGATPRTGVFADDEPMTPLGDPRGQWWVAGHRAKQITAVYQPYPKPIGYRLRDTSVHSDRYPNELAVEQWNDRAEEDDTFYRFYEAVTEDQPEVRYEYPGPFLVLEAGEPPAPDAPLWVAELPTALTQRPEYQHCFPGYIPGLSAHMADVIKKMRHVQYCFNGRDDKPAGLYVTIRVPFQEPVSRWRPKYGARGQELKSKEEVENLVTREMHLPVPDRVYGPNYQVALEDWTGQVEFWTQVARDASVKACNACQGTGHVLDVPEAAAP
ncbi:hypothetical protein [[Kitasatospora] papulosa]|uniref:hypothetical protein n=1 Tax=[Kitasatospora] papulosa TaxID=1464011 RepID=UPI0036C12522